MENVLKTNPKDIEQQYQKKIDDLHAAYGKAMLENKFLKKLRAILNPTRSLNRRPFRDCQRRGATVTISQACRWSGLPRRTFYYKTQKVPVKLNEQLVERVKRVIDSLSFADYRIVACISARRE